MHRLSVAALGSARGPQQKTQCASRGHRVAA